MNRLSILIALLVPLTSTGAAAGHGQHSVPVAWGQGAQLGIYPLGPLPYSRTPFGAPTIAVAPHARAPVSPSFAGYSIRRTASQIRYSPTPGAQLFVPPVIYGAVPYGYEPPIPMQAATVVYQTVPVVVMPSPLASSQPVVQPQYAIGPQEPAGDAITSRAVPRAPPPPVKNSGGSGLYGWMDDAGNTHLTDRWEDVPPGYRDRAKRYAS